MLRAMAAIQTPRGRPRRLAAVLLAFLAPTLARGAAAVHDKLAAEIARWRTEADRPTSADDPFAGSRKDAAKILAHAAADLESGRPELALEGLARGRNFMRALALHDQHLKVA